MAKSYADLLNKARSHRLYLDAAIDEGNAKDILYYRGKYIADLKKNFKLNPSGVVPTSVSGYARNVSIEDAISNELRLHKNHIDASIRSNKSTATMKTHALSKEFGLKIRRLSTRYSQINFAKSEAEKNMIKKETVRDKASLAGTVAKAPFMVTAKVASKVGPLGITLLFLPANVLASLLSVTIDVSTGEVSSDMSKYNNTPINVISKDLKNAVKTLSNKTYEAVGRM